MATITYKNQNAAHTALKQGVPIEGTEHIYTVNSILWPKQVEKFVESLFIGKTLHVCSGKSTIGDLKVDLFDETAELKANAAKIPLRDKTFDTVLSDPPYNGKLQWNHDLLTELARIARKRIIFQHWFMPGDKLGRYRKDHNFKISQLYLWQPRTYFGRANVLSVFDFDVNEEQPHD
jgi:hypothetical protein